MRGRSTLPGVTLVVLAACSADEPERNTQRNVANAPFDATRNDPRCGGPVERYGGNTAPIVRNEQMALDIANRYLASEFPELQEGPGLCTLHARLESGVWQVEGELPAGWLGGCLNIHICQLNGRVVRLWGEQ